MPRYSKQTFHLEIHLDRTSGETLDKQISSQIREGISKGILKPGDHLPPVRSFAKYIGVARATLNEAYATLTAEGYIDATPGRGSFISTQLPDKALFGDRRGSDCGQPHATAPEKSLNRNADFCRKANSILQPQANVPLAVVTPSRQLSPGKDFMAIAARVFKNLNHYLRYTDPQGLPELREQICEVGQRLRGIKADPSQVIITSGSQHGFSMVTRLLFNPGDKVLFEDPSYPLLRAVATFNGLEIVGVPVDTDGMVVERGIELAPDAKGAFVTPSHQCPLGMLMSIERRHQLLNWAETQGKWIIEDDYDSELKYGGDLPYPCLQGMDSSGSNVIYTGTFSKMIFPGYRLGYLIVPPDLVEVFSGFRLITERQGNEALQAIVAEYMREGFYEIHVRRMRKGFEERRAILAEACVNDLSEWGEIVSGNQGMHVLFRFHNQEIDDMAIERLCLRENIEARACSFHYAGTAPVKGLILGFGFFEPDQIVATIRRVAFILRNHFAGYAIGPGRPLRARF